MRALCAAILAVAACASVDPRPAIESANQLAADRLDRQISWRSGSGEDAAVDKRLKDLLASDLSVDAAVEIALLNNRSLQAVYEDIGIAQADLVQAGLLRNPTLGAAVRFPSLAGAPLDYDFSLTQEFLDLFALPLRKRIAGQRLERAKLRVADAVLRLAASTRAAWYELQSAEQMTEMLATIADAAKAAAEFAARQREAGNITEIDLIAQQDAADAASVSLARSELDRAAARERLTRLLGVFGAAAQFKSPGRLPELPAQDPPVERLETAAVERRLDLAAARREVEALAYVASLERGTRLTPTVEVGVSLQHESPEGVTVTGPNVNLQLPIFDQGQARVARVEAQLRQSEARLDELAVQVRSEVREARTRVLAARGIAVYYQRYVVPRRELLVKRLMLQYNAMQVGIYQLLGAKQNETAAYREYIEAVRDYWVARSDLELSVGGSSGSRK